MKETQNKTNKFTKSNTLKMFMVGLLILVLLVPLLYIQNLIKERARTRDTAVTEINDSWGKAIQLYGPILKVPYYQYTETETKEAKTGKITTHITKNLRYAYFFPDEIELEANLSAENKKRGIYETAVYNMKGNIKGLFTNPEFSKLDIKPKDVVWNKAQFVIETTNTKGIKEHLKIKSENYDLTFTADFNKTRHINHPISYQPISMYTLETKAFDLRKMFTENRFDFQIDYAANGSHSFEFIPIGKETKMHLSSQWKDTNFMGAYLPYNKDKVHENGFDANWSVLEMNRPFRQEFTSLPDLSAYNMGVKFIIPIDNYLQNERSAKYGYLVISLTFLIFFLIQLLSKINIHPFQYLMIGLALVIFYTLLLSITEHSTFSKAYLISSSATVVLISLYAKSILKTWKFGLFILIALGVLYAFIYTIIQLESYALLVGSVGLFTILAAVMYASRKIDWG